MFVGHGVSVPFFTYMPVRKKLYDHMYIYTHLYTNINIRRISKNDEIKHNTT
jgi:hypothetical protein